MAALRREGLERLPDQGAAQVGRERRPVTHREDAGLGTRMGGHAGAVAGGEHQRVAARGEGRLHREEAALVERQAGAGEPGGGAGLRHHEHVVDRQPLAGVELNRVGIDARRGGILDQPHAPAREDGAHASPRCNRLAGQDLALGGKHDGDLGIARDLAQPMVDGQRQLDAAGAAANHGDAQRALPVLHPFEEAQPALAQFGDRLHRRRMLGCAGDRTHAGRRADVERHEIVGDRRTILQQHLPVGAIEPECFGMDQARAGPSAEPRKIDVALVEGIGPGDEARDHAGIGRLDVPPDQGDPHTGHRLHAEALHDMDMRMAAAHEHEILEEGRGLHRLSFNAVAGGTIPPSLAHCNLLVVLKEIVMYIN